MHRSRELRTLGPQDASEETICLGLPTQGSREVTGLTLERMTNCLDLPTQESREVTGLTLEMMIYLDRSMRGSRASRASRTRHKITILSVVLEATWAEMQETRREFRG